MSCILSMKDIIIAFSELKRSATFEEIARMAGNIFITVPLDKVEEATWQSLQFGLDNKLILLKGNKYRVVKNVYAFFNGVPGSTTNTAHSHEQIDDIATVNDDTEMLKEYDAGNENFNDERSEGEEVQSNESELMFSNAFETAGTEDKEADDSVNEEWLIKV